MQSIKLTPLGQKIFLDRYALKETDRSKLRVGDTLLVTHKEHPRWPVRAIATALEVRGDEVLAEYRDPDTGDPVVRVFNTREVDICRETIEEAIARVARGLASVEKDPEYWARKFESVLSNFRFVPGGRIYTGAGSGLNVTFFNCYVLPSPHDSRKGIFERLGQMAEVLARGGGVGINFSSLRPRNAIIYGTMGRSSGSVSWANLYSATILNISQGGSRRGAGMAQWEIWHPDVPEVIECKKTPGVMEGFNISIRVSRKFMEALEKDENWTFVFPDTAHPRYDEEWDGNLEAWVAKGYPVIEYQTVRARDLWDKMMRAAWESAEPGIIFKDTIEDESNSRYYTYLICTNPCGEQPLPSWGVCTLGHINLARHVHGPIGQAVVDWDAIAETTRLGVRMLDNVIDATPYFFEENRERQQSERRIGMGTLGLGEMLIRLGIRYGANKKCLDFLDQLYSFIAYHAYWESTELAREKGPFPLFDADQFLRSGFVKRLIARFPDLEERIRKYGMRNVTLITQAPTGTVGTMVDTSTGIEPFYALKFVRQSRLGTDVQYMGIAREFMEQHPELDELPDYFVGAMDLEPMDHLMVQAVVQRWTDSACSKTANLPHDATVEDVDLLYRKAYELGLKGFTIYRDGSRAEQVLHLADKEEEKEEPEVHREDIELMQVECKTCGL